MPSSTAEGDLGKDQPLSPWAYPLPDSSEESSKESGDVPVVVEHKPPSSGLGEDVSSHAFILVPRNPLTTVGSSSDAESQSDSVASAKDPAGQLPSPAQRPPPPSDPITVDPKAKRLWDAIRASGLNRDTQVHELVEIGRCLDDHHRVLQVCFCPVLVLFLF
jgi:hypothetical protein